MGTIVSIVHSPPELEAKPPDHYSRVPLAVATLAAGCGIVGDRKSGQRSRHLNVMAAETLEQLGVDGYRTGPGSMGEQLVIAGLPIDRLAPGTRIRLGATAVIEVVEPRTGCVRLRQIQGCTPADVAGRLGVMARVRTGGTIAVGDRAELLDAAPEVE